MATPAVTAYDRHLAGPRAAFVVPTAGHAGSELGIRRRALAATDRFAR